MTVTAFSLEASGQTSKPVTIDVTDMELPAALRQVERQSGYYKISYDADLVRNYRVTASIKDQSALMAVRILVHNLPFNVTVDGNYIYLTPQESVATATNEVKGKQGSISGIVIDETNQPLAGVVVRQRNGKGMAMTDAEGRFSIATAEKKDFAVSDFDTYPLEQWRDGMFYFEDAPLIDVLISLGKWYGVSIVAYNESQLHRRIHFVADRTDNVADIVPRLNRILRSGKLSYDDRQLSLH